MKNYRKRGVWSGILIVTLIHIWIFFYFATLDRHGLGILIAIPSLLGLIITIPIGILIGSKVGDNLDRKYNPNYIENEKYNLIYKFTNIALFLMLLIAVLFVIFRFIIV